MVAMLALLYGIAMCSYAQPEINTDFITKMNAAFAPLDKSKVPNGLLLDYAFEFTNLSSLQIEFKGIKTANTCY